MRLHCIVLIFAVAYCRLISAESALSNKTDTKPVIAYGYDASRGQFPWMVSIIHQSSSGPKHFCGGTLIAPLYVLTAAHCTLDNYGNPFPGPWTMKIGCLNWRTDGEGQCDVRGAAAYTSHPYYDYRANGLQEGYDIALIRLSSPSKMPLMPLASGFPAIGTTVTAAGWGRLETLQLPDVMKWTNLKISGIDYAKFLIKTGSDKTETCKGDSGGPIYTSAGQVGITSWGPDCGNTYGWYTNIGSFRSWISDTMTAINPSPPPSSISDGYDKTISLSSGRVSYEVCSCNAPSVFGSQTVIGSKGQIWRFIPTSSQTTPKRYYIKAASTSTCPGSEAEYLYLTAPACISDGDTCGTSQGPFLAFAIDTGRQEWLLEEVAGGYKIRNANRFDSRYLDSYVGMSGASGSLFFVSSASSSSFIFTISTTSDSIFYSCSAPQLPSPIPSPTPAPVPSPSPSPSPSPLPSPNIEPSPSPSPKPSPRSPPRTRKPPPRGRGVSPPNKKSPPRRPPPRRPPPRRPPPLQSPPLLLSPPPPLLSPPPPAATEMLSPGIDFVLIIPGYTTTTFGTAQQNSLCSAITNGWSPSASCTVSNVSPYSGTPSAVIVSGFAYFTFSTAPTLNQLTSAVSLRDARVAALTTNAGSILGGIFPGTVPFCACKGFNILTTSSTASYNYADSSYKLPNRMQCDAKLTYDSNNPNAVLSQVGVDDGSSNNSNLGKYCSTPAVNGGVSGIPGSGSCRQYGVIILANVNKLCSATPIASLSPAIGYEVQTAVTFAGPCRPLGRNTYRNQVCSIPAAPGGLLEILNAENCNVQSSFISQPGSTTTSSCGVLPQSFTISVA